MVPKDILFMIDLVVHFPLIPGPVPDKHEAQLEQLQELYKFRARVRRASEDDPE